MTKIMNGVRILEVAQHTFVPVAGAILADWGADVVKIEHPVRGDTMRGFRSTGGVEHNPNRHTLVEHANRGKRSVGIDVSKPQGQDLIYEIARTADVFLTNYLPAQRQKLRVDLEHIRAANPKIIYARGSAYGDKGPEREVGGFDGTAFWTRSGVGYSMSPEALERPLMQGIPAFGDCIGGMNIAGGIMGALFHRERTGEALELDVSLMSSAWWAAGSGMAQVMETGLIPRTRMSGGGGSPGNPFMGNFTTSDGGTINFCALTPGPYIRDVFTHLGIPQAADDPRFASVEALMKNWADASALMVQAIGKQSFGYWREHLRTMKAQWAPFLSLADLAQDAQALEAPEFQIANESSVVGCINYLQRAVAGQIADLTPDSTALLAIADDADALLAELNLVLAADQLSAATVTALATAVATMASGSDATRGERINAALVLVMAAPEYIVQK